SVSSRTSTARRCRRDHPALRRRRPVGGRLTCPRPSSHPPDEKSPAPIDRTSLSRSAPSTSRGRRRARSRRSCATRRSCRASRRRARGGRDEAGLRDAAGTRRGGRTPVRSPDRGPRVHAAQRQDLGSRWRGVLARERDRLSREPLADARAPLAQPALRGHRAVGREGLGMARGVRRAAADAHARERRRRVVPRPRARARARPRALAADSVRRVQRHRSPRLHPERFRGRPRIRLLALDDSKEERTGSMNDTPQLRNFGQVLQSLEDGQLIADLTDKLQELNGKLARQAEARGKAKGEIVLKLKLLADEGGTVQIDGEIVCKEPKAARARSVLWLTKENTL